MDSLNLIFQGFNKQYTLIEGSNFNRGDFLASTHIYNNEARMYEYSYPHSLFDPEIRVLRSPTLRLLSSFKQRGIWLQCRSRCKGDRAIAMGRPSPPQPNDLLKPNPSWKLNNNVQNS